MIAVIGKIILSSGPWVRSLLVLAGAGIATWAGWGFAVSIRRAGEEVASLVDKLPSVSPFEIVPDPDNPGEALIMPKKKADMTPIILGAGIAVVVLVLLVRR